jgi:hypothetical protein
MPCRFLDLEEAEETDVTKIELTGAASVEGDICSF